MTPRLCFLDLRGDTLRPMAAPLAPLCLALGNFDGVHGAHRRLLSEVGHMAESMTAAGVPALRGVFSFFAPSTDFLQGGHREHLTTLREKLYLWKSAGSEVACLCNFGEIRSLSPHAFLDFLRREIGTVGVVCGENFRFGQFGAGTAQDLRRAFDRPAEGLRAAVIPSLTHEGEPISSTRIRGLLRSGLTEEANALLCAPYALETTVIHGKHLGRSLGFPTANQRFPAEKLVPAHGVYAVACHTPYGVFPGVSNVGVRPTVEHGATVNCETYIIGLHADLYGHRIRVEFLKFLRPETRFDSVHALTEAIHHDAETAEKYVQAYVNKSI